MSYRFKGILIFVLILTPEIIDEYTELIFYNTLWDILSDIIKVLIIYFLIYSLFKKMSAANEKLEYMALHDALTDLPNRYSLKKRLTDIFEKQSDVKKSISILLLDLDRFKIINDTMGHTLGDNLLIKVSDRLRLSVRNNDTVYRHGGDEFIILLEDIDEPNLQDIVKRILGEFSTPFILDGEEFHISPSIGVSLYPGDGEDAETLIKNADIAMYAAKKSGKNNYQFFLREPEEIIKRRIKLERGLRQALDNNEFVLYYQPQIELKTGELKGLEALIRWNHPEYGMVSPLEFIPIAEENGLIVPIGNWVIEEACTQNKAWQESGFPAMRVAVNVSAIQFHDKNFVENVEQIHNKLQLAPEFLELEITESVMQDIEESASILNQLKKIGVKTSIDDFGTGYSSLSVLNRLPIDFVKIDKSFIDEIVTNSNTASLVNIMIDIGTRLKFELIAEGIENEQQAAFLNEKGCRFGQGYLYSPPLPVKEIESLIAKQILSIRP